MQSFDPQFLLERRQLLRSAGAIGLGSFFSGGIVSAASAPALEPAVLASACTLTPAAVQGPFWVNPAFVRRDITEGQSGLLLELVFKVVRQSDCSPIVGAVVDVWQANFRGRYSGFASEGTAGRTWLRGIQTTGPNGIVHFVTVLPGWYPGRTAHLHLKINPTTTQDVTTQLYFQPEITESVFGLPPYNVRGLSPTTNDNDAFFTPELLMPTHKLAPAMLGPLAGSLQLPQLIAGKTIVIAAS